MLLGCSARGSHYTEQDHVTVYMHVVVWLLTVWETANSSYLYTIASSWCHEYYCLMWCWDCGMVSTEVRDVIHKNFGCPQTDTGYIYVRCSFEIFYAPDRDSKYRSIQFKIVHLSVLCECVIDWYCHFRRACWLLTSDVFFGLCCYHGVRQTFRFFSELHTRGSPTQSVIY